MLIFFFQTICQVAPEYHLTVSLGRCAGNVWNIVSYSAGKIRIRLLLFHALLFSLFQIHLALSTPSVIVDTFLEFLNCDDHSFSFHLTLSNGLTAATLEFQKDQEWEPEVWTRSVFPRGLELEQRAREWNCLCHPIQASMPVTTACGLGSCGWASFLHHVEWGAEVNFCWGQIKKKKKMKQICLQRWRECTPCFLLSLKFTLFSLFWALSAFLLIIPL